MLNFKEINTKNEVSNNNLLVVNEDIVEEDSNINVSYFKAIRETFFFSLPLIGSRLPVIGSNFGNGAVLKYLGDNYVAAGPLITTFQSIITGTVRGCLLSIAIIVSKSCKPDKPQELGRILRQGWLGSTLLSIPSIALLALSDKILISLNVNSLIAKEVQNFFLPFIFGIPATYWFISDQQLAVGISKPVIQLIATDIYIALAMLCGYPLAIKTPLKIAGLGCGYTISAWLSLVGLRVYYRANKNFDKYKIFSINYKDVLKKACKTAKFAFPMGLQVLTEWGNLFIISLITQKLGEIFLQAEQPSLILINSFTLISSTIGQSVGLSISREIGKRNSNLKQKKFEYAEIHHKNARKITIAGNLYGLAISIVFCILFIALSEQLTSLFVKKDEDYLKILEISKKLILINSLGLIIDTIRNVMTSALNGHGNSLFSPLVSFLFISVLGIPAGYSTSVNLNKGIEWLFITRTLGILLATISITAYWTKVSFGSNEIPRENSSLLKKEPKNCLWGQSCNFFRKDNMSENRIGATARMSLMNYSL